MLFPVLCLVIHFAFVKEDVLMVVTSDHGMSGQGSHGGTTSSEVDTPLVFLSPLIRQHK